MSLPGVQTLDLSHVSVLIEFFPRCYEIDWRSRIISVTESYVVLDKPAGTSVRNWLFFFSQKIYLISLNRPWCLICASLKLVHVCFSNILVHEFIVELQILTFLGTVSYIYVFDPTYGSAYAFSSL